MRAERSGPGPRDVYCFCFGVADAWCSGRDQALEYRIPGISQTGRQTYPVFAVHQSFWRARISRFSLFSLRDWSTSVTRPDHQSSASARPTAIRPRR
jgi:hypothetical protein